MVFEEPQPFRWPELPERREFAEAEDSDRIWPMLSEIYPDDFDPLADRSPYVPQLTNFADAFKVKVTSSDSLPEYLSDKIEATFGVTEEIIGDAGTTQTLRLQARGYNSIAVVAEGIQLVNDASAPGADKVYGTDAHGDKGWRDPVAKVKVSSDDTTPNFLLSKLASSDGTIVIAEANGGGDEDVDLTVDETQLDGSQIDISTNTEVYKIVISPSDTNPGYLSDKLTEGEAIYFDDSGAGEDIRINVKHQNSIVLDGGSNAIELDGDEASPGNSKYYGTDASGTKGFHAVSDLGHIEPEIPGTYVVLGSSDEGSEAADTTDWLISTDRSKGLQAWWMWRVAYFDAGDQKLYGYLRRAEFDKYGHLTKVTAESRVEIDVPESC